MFSLNDVTLQQLEEMAERAKRAYEKESRPHLKKEKLAVWQTRVGDIDRKKRGVVAMGMTQDGKPYEIMGNTTKPIGG